jgi:lysophospholipase L1-like esterase
MKPTETKTYLALGDSMSIDAYTGVPGGGAVAQLYKRLQTRQDASWRLIDESFDGCTIAGVPLTHRPGGVDLITITIAGNDLLQNMYRKVEEYRPEFERAYCRLLGEIHKLARHTRNGEVTDAIVIVGNVYRPATDVSEHLLDVLDGVNAFIAEKVRNYGFRLADVHGAFLGHEEEYLCLGIEPTLAGATAIAGLFEEAAFAS